jgi:APA family basic amino acid/polyamine antiporter
MKIRAGIDATYLLEEHRMGGNEEQNQPVKPRLGLFDAVSIMVGIVIGATIYKAPPLIFSFASTPEWGIGVWVIGGVLSLIGALCYAELASTYPRMGGDYVYLSRAFGPWAGFLFGWTQLAIILTASTGMMAFVFGENAVNALIIPPESVLEQMRADPEPWQNRMGLALAIVPPEQKAEWTAGLALAAVILLSIMNVLGVILGKLVQNLLSLVKVIGLGAIAYVGFSSIQPTAFTYTPGDSGPNLGLAMIFVLYAYGGWNDMAFVAAELKNKRNIPRALILGTSLITIIYVAVNVAYLLSLGFDGARRPGQPIAAAVLDKELGAFAGKGMSVLVMISALGAMNGLIFAGSRVYSSLGADWGLFALLGRWNQRFGSPLWALLIQAAITIVMIFAVGTSAGRGAIDSTLAWLGEQLPITGLGPLPWFNKFDGGFDALLGVTAPVFWLFFLGTGISLFALRQRDPDRERPFHVPLYPLVPVIFCGMCFFMLYKSLAWAGDFALLGWVPLAIGIPLYYLSSRTGGEAPAPPPVHERPSTAPATVDEATAPPPPPIEEPTRVAAPPADVQLPAAPPKDGQEEHVAPFRFEDHPLPEEKPANQSPPS